MFLVFLQLMLFPDTPPAVLTSLRLHASTDPAAEPNAVAGADEPDVAVIDRANAWRA